MEYLALMTKNLHWWCLSVMLASLIGPCGSVSGLWRWKPFSPQPCWLLVGSCTMISGGVDQRMCPVYWSVSTYLPRPRRLQRLRECGWLCPEAALLRWHMRKQASSPLQPSALHRFPALQCPAARVARCHHSSTSTFESSAQPVPYVCMYVCMYVPLFHASTRHHTVPTRQLLSYAAFMNCRNYRDCSSCVARCLGPGPGPGPRLGLGSECGI
jgi:hypothetical protein